MLTSIGCGLVSYFTSTKVAPISPLGLAVATGGAFIILFFYKLLGGYFFHEGEVPRRTVRAYHRRRRYEAVRYDD